MAKATIKSKTGAVITVEGSESEVSAILATIEGGASVAHAKRTADRAHKSGKVPKKRQGASELVSHLKNEGFFDKPRGIGEVAHALQENGYLYPVTSLSGVLLALVQKRLLRRKKHEGKWVYGK
ncbi:MAG: hypothetical protein ACRD3O_00310 [Terriglobia bacterium]